MKVQFKKYIRVIVSLTLLLSIVSSYKSQTLAQEADVLADNGLELNKTATDNNDGTYTIRLEAYTTGTVTTIEKSKPTDVVLVLDQSGSMSEQIGYKEIYKPMFNNGSPFNKVQKGKSYYIEEGDTYKKVDYCNFVSIKGNFVHTWKDTSGQVMVATNLDGSNPTEGLYPAYQMYAYSTMAEGPTKLDSLKDAAGIFVDNIIKDGGDHRIAVVGFGSGEDESYVNTELFVGANQYQYNSANISENYAKAFQSTTSSTEKANIKASINALTASGATRADLGMEMANQVLKNDPNISETGRNKIVVMFTDGEPTDYDKFDDNVANKAIGEAKLLKEKGTKVYTVGVVKNLNSDLDPSLDTTDKLNKYMQYVSNNFPNAKSLTDAGNDGDYTKGNFLAATDSESLAKVFSKISEDISSTPMPLDEQTIFKDIVSDYFIAPTAVDIKTYTSACTGKVDDTFTWGEAVAINGLDVKVDPKSKTVDVKGFNYKENFVAINDVTKEPQGKKLIVEFKTSVMDGFIGGDEIFTNGDQSGLYVGDDLVEAFPLPKVDVPIRFNLPPVNSLGIYIGSKEENLESLFDASIEDSGLQYKILDKTYTLDGIKNAFVDITYTVKNDSGESIGKYVVKAGQTVGKWETSIDTSTFTNNTPIKVEVDVTSTNKNTNKVVDNQQGVIYVYTPTITTNTLYLFLGETCDLDSGIQSVTWTNSDANAIQPTGTKPKLTYTYKTAAGDTISPSNRYQPKDSIVVNATVYNGTRDITNNTQMPKGIEIIVVKGELTIHKTIDNYYTQNEDINANQSFVFKIERRDEIGGEIKDTYYQTLDFSSIDNAKTKTLTVQGMSKGYYTITEESQWSWKYGEVATARIDNYPSNGTSAGVGENQNIYIGERNVIDGYMFYGSQTGTTIQNKPAAFPASVSFQNNLEKSNILGDAANAKNQFTKGE